MPCLHCASPTTVPKHKTAALGYQMFLCAACRPSFNERISEPVSSPIRPHGRRSAGKIAPASANARMTPSSRMLSATMVATPVRDPSPYRASQACEKTCADWPPQSETYG